MPNSLRKAWFVARRLGFGFVRTRVRNLVDKKLGLTRRRFQSRPWATISLDDIVGASAPHDVEGYAAFKRTQPVHFLFPLGRPPALPEELLRVDAGRTPDLAERVRLLTEDRCVLFFKHVAPGPVDWNASPLTGGRSPSGVPWCDVPDFLPEQGDVRAMWEPARAAWAIDLARAQSRGLGTDAASLYWRWVDSWMAACPPFEGVHWKCGQESAVRLIALTVGFWVFADGPECTPARWEQLARLAWATGYRIYHHIDYAVSQKNNHAISEACGLILVGLLFPEFREAAQWLRRGRQVLARELRRQIYADGGYVQHSMNYERVMMHGALVALRLAELNDQPLDRDLYDALGRCAAFMFEMMEPRDGRTPNYGNNDGALVLPLSECDFTDYRPAIQATHYLAHRKRLLPRGPWDEDLAWLFGVESLTADAEPPRQPCSSAFRASGYYTLRGDQSWTMTRCHMYRDRPAHCDETHVDLWHRGVNVLQDAGTFEYFVPDRPDVARYFKSARAHNVVEIDGRDPMELISRFLWMPWPQGKVLQQRLEGDGSRWITCQCEPYGRPGGAHVARIRTLAALDNDVWLIIDELAPRRPGAYRATVRWRFADAPYALDAERRSVRLRADVGEWECRILRAPDEMTRFEVLRGVDEPERVQGFAAPYYAERLPVPVLEAEFECRGHASVITVVGPAPLDAEAALASWTSRPVSLEGVQNRPR